MGPHPHSCSRACSRRAHRAPALVGHAGGTHRAQGATLSSSSPASQRVREDTRVDDSLCSGISHTSVYLDEENPTLSKLHCTKATKDLRIHEGDTYLRSFCTTEGYKL